MITIGGKLERYSGIAPGFDLLRVALAVSVVAWHSFSVARNAVWLDGAPGVWFIGYAILVMFFALSGFLITGSAQRLNLKDFLINRGLRIVPALAVEIALSAFVLGAIFTSLPLADYFAHPQTYHYLTNIVGLINYHLPGVFDLNRVDAVNWSLWTVPHEIVCYVIMSAIILLGVTRNASFTLASAVAFMALGLFFYFVIGVPDTGFYGKAVNFLLIQKSAKLYVGFLLGIFIFQARDRIPYSWPLFIGCLLLCGVLAALGPSKVLSMPVLSLIAAPPLVYITAFLGVTELPTLPVFRKGDYSYGIYLYGMPLQQAMAASFPMVKSPLGQLALALPMIVLFAAFSWHMIEKPILGLRKRFSFVARVRELDGKEKAESTEPILPPAVGAENG